MRVMVLERNGYVGGLCRTIHHNGYKFDLGGHRWFTKNEDLNRWFRELMEGEIVWVDRISRIYYGGKYFNYPVRFGDVVRKSGPLTILHAGLSFLWAVVKNALGSKPPVTMRDAYVRQFGYKLYDMFFRLYSEKVWGLPCDQLSADWVTQRSKGLSIWTVIRDALAGSGGKVVSLIEQFMYPRDGYMRIPERMAEDITAAGSEVVLGSTVTRITYNGPRDFVITYSQDGVEKTTKADAVVSTIPLGLLARIFEPQCDDAVTNAAQALVFRDLITVNVMINRPQVTGDTWLYVQDHDILFGRIHEPKNWSPAMVPDDGVTSLVLECFCSRGDDIWSMSDEDVAARCIDDLVTKLEFIDRDDVVDTNVARVTQAYPVYDLQYKQRIDVIQDFLQSFNGLYTVGRGGTFRYNNADHSIEMGLLVARRILGESIDFMSVNTEHAYHEEVREGDETRADLYTYFPSSVTLRCAREAE